MMLTKNLSIEEYFRGEVVTDELKNNAIALAVNVFQPLRDYMGVPINVNSGYRSPAYNKKIGGAKGSQHTKAEAIDLDTRSIELNKKMFDYIKDNLEFDQLINEFNYAWIHVSFSRKGNRKQVLNAIKRGGRTTYLNY